MSLIVNVANRYFTNKTTTTNMASIARGLSRLPLIRQICRPLSTTSSLQAKVQDGKYTDESTHTGQEWAADDFRRVRFVDRKKLVNPNFSIDLIAKDPVVVCERRSVSSNSGGPLGHPKVYINLDKPQISTCGYSGRKFIHKKYYDPAKHGPSITYEEYLQDMLKEKS